MRSIACALVVTHVHIDHVGRIPHLLAAPRPPYGADLLVLENTYGDCIHESRKDRRQRLQTVCEHAFGNRGRPPTRWPSSR